MQITVVVSILLYAALASEQNVVIKDSTCDQTESCCSKNTYTECKSCKSGYHGGRCRNICPERCLTCTDHPVVSAETNGRGYCINCTAGYYSTHALYQCQTACPDECSTCVSFVSPPYDCDSCKAGYQLMLLSGNIGKCITCPANCKKCTSDYSCSECNVGYYGPACNIPCSSGCKRSNCSKETGICLEGCTSDGFISGGKCEMCLDGRYGSNCVHVCSKNCQSACDKTTGYCAECINNFAGNMCEKCTHGFYGEDCNSSCPVNCRENKCQQTTGVCVSCNEGFAGDKCSFCVSGMYGNNCDKTCPIKCVGKTCNRSSGDCFACVGNFTGLKCDRCADGFFLHAASNEISDGSTCSECSKTCKSCYSIEKCIQCVTGYFGEDCQQKCSVGCKNDTCEYESGICSFNCSTYFVGSKCDECSRGKFSVNCSLSCPEHCIACNRSSGNCSLCEQNFTGSYCEDCIVGVYGIYCNQTCPEHCNHSQCDRYTANCSFGCIEFFTGPMCEECVEGKYGHHCNEPCPENCLESTCARSSGHCYNCSGNFNGSKCDNCVYGLYGENCTENCSVTCEGSHWESIDLYSVCKKYLRDHNNEGMEKIGGGTIAGGVVGILVLFGLSVVLVFFLQRRFNRQKMYTDTVLYQNQITSEGPALTNLETGSVYNIMSLPTAHMERTLQDLRRENERLKELVTKNEEENRAMEFRMQELISRLEKSDKDCLRGPTYESLRSYTATDGLYSSLVRETS